MLWRAPPNNLILPEGVAMKEIADFLLPENTGAKLSIFDVPIIAVLQAFSVVVGAALTRFFVEPRVVDAQNFRAWKRCNFVRELFYWSVLTVLITLAIRFLVGSGVHLRMTYKDIQEFLPANMRRFLKDLFFLFAFGAFLVRAALSKEVRSFARWLMLFSTTGCIWSSVEYLFYSQHPDPLAGGWFFINTFQLVTTAICWQLAPKEQENKSGLAIVVSLMVIFSVIFCIDLAHILNSST